MRVTEVAGQPASPGDDVGGAPAMPGVISAAAGSGGHQLASRMRDTLAARHAAHAVRQQDARSAETETVHAAREAGGEQAVIYLASLLGDDWTLIRGYQNSAGSIGQILLGAPGVVAMTSLHLDATVHCNGDRWRADQFGRDGKLAGQSTLTDQAGRSPSTHLNQAADTLEQFLHAAGTPITVARVVLLTHPRSYLQDQHQPALRIFSSPYDLARWLEEQPEALGKTARQQIEHHITHGEHPTAPAPP